MMYQQTVNFWFQSLQYVGLNPEKQKKWVFTVMVAGGTILYALTFAEFFFSPDPNYIHTVESIVIFCHMMSKTGAIFYFSKELQQLHKDLEHFWSFESDEQLKDYCYNKLISIHKGAKIYLSYFVFSIIMITIVPLVTSRSLQMYVYVPEALGTNFVWLLESLIIPLITVSVFAFDYLIFTFLQLTIVQFQLSNSSIRKLNFGEHQDNGELRTQLVKLVKHHIFMLKFTKRLQRIMSLPLLVQLFNTVSAFCIEMYLMRYNVDLGQGIIGSLHSLVVFVQICYFYCTPCQDVMDQGLEIAIQVYSINWYELEDNSLKMLLKMIIMRGSEPIDFSAAGFVQINLAALVMVFKTSLSFYSFLVAIDT